MPITSAARRASRASSRVQQPRAPVRNDLGLLESARCTPTTSYPASAARAAATAESTPPDIAASTRRGRFWLVISVYEGGRRHRANGADRVIGGPGPALQTRPTGTRDHRSNRADQGVDVGLGRGVAEGEAERAASPLLALTHRQQDVAGLGDASRARRAGRTLDAARVEEHKECIALAARE